MAARRPPLYNIEVGSSASPGGKIKGCKDMWRSVEAQHGGARGRGGAGTRGRVGCQSPTSSSPTSWGRSTPSCSLVMGATEAEPAVGTTSQQDRRGRETAGLPQGGKTPLGSRFFKHWDFCKSLSPLSLFMGAEILGLLNVGKLSFL